MKKINTTIQNENLIELINLIEELDNAILCFDSLGAKQAALYIIEKITILINEIKNEI